MPEFLTFSILEQIRGQMTTNEATILKYAAFTKPGF